MDSGVLNTVLSEFLKALQQDYSKIQELAKILFYYLAGIQIVVSALWLMFRGDPIDAAVKTIQMFFVIAVFYTLVLFGGSWMPQIINGFISIGAHAGNIQSLTPSSVMSQGVSIGFAILDNFGNWGWITHPFGSLLACAILIAIIILYALLAAEVAIILVKSYVLISVSGLMFAFGASEPVRQIAMNYFKAVIGIGLQLMTFYLIMGVGVTVGQDWAVIIGQAAQAHALKPFLVVMAAVVVFYMIVKNVPPFVAGLSGIGGFRSYGDAAVGAALTAGGVGASAMQRANSMVGGSIQGTGQATSGIYKMGQYLVGAKKAGASLHTATGRAVGQGTSSVGSSIKDSIMRVNQHMTFGQKFNAKMTSKISQLQTKKASIPGNNFKPNSVKK